MPAKQKTQPGKKRILIVDDHPIMRQGLAQLINGESDLMVSWEADNAVQALSVISTDKPDLMLADISLPGKGGLELIKDVHVLRPEMPILALSMHDETLYAERVLRAGARGYIMKQQGGKKLMEVIRVVLGGQIYVSEKISSMILETLSGSRAGSKGSSIAQLSDREFEVFQLFGEGKGTREIAEKLHLSVKTVEVHRANIKQKLELKTARDLVRYAVRWMDAQGTA